ncbi:hypothetical protein [Corallococcus exiguus]|uniref:Uncharacterized protein n=1 Tax=Corallococcus exiguus TaxID=83462 RepID=A0A7X5BQZ2_9BACT|nr:hypothetical protein [Corallococcus exiguus]NBC40440.1 hypothetical protein [Corallococcus exiguus]TNV46818.1 hypothetical protein FH620_41980 [Corallococcus exiguus]
MSRCRLPAVRCEHCGATRLVGAVTPAGLLAPHAPRIASKAVRAKHPGPWPTCRHGLAALADCADRPIPPECCPHLIPDTTP